MIRPFAALVLLLASLSAADLTGQYAWSQVRTDGGGWVTGMVIHPSEAGLMYVRTDVGGAYRWNPTTSRWSQIMTAGRGLPDGVSGGVESIALSKLAPDQVFLATNGGVFRSADRGATWSLGSGTAALAMDANGEYRWHGERLAVDPQNAQVVYFGSRQDGLWRSLDGGASYARLTAVPAGVTERDSAGREVNGTAIGISWVVIDGGGGATSGRSSRIYAGVAGQGIWRSLDGGTNWASISGGSGPAAGVIPSDAEIGSDGRLWVSAISNYTQVGGVWTRAQGSLWSYDRTTSTWTVRRPSGSDQSWAELAVDPTNANRVIVADQSFVTYITTNGGGAWGYRAPNTSTWQAPEAPWIGVTTAANELWRSWSSPGALTFDPLSAGRLWYAEGFGVWSTADATANPVVWTNRAAGIEETVAFGAVHPPGGRLVTGTADLGGFHHDQGTAAAPGRRILTQGFTTTTSLTWCRTTPSFIAAVSANHHQNWLDYSGYSSDGGQTWQRFASLANGTHPAELKFGTIAIAADSPQKLVWAPWNWGGLHYSSDGGATWHPGVISGTSTRLTDLHYGSSWATSAAVVPDGASAGTFYCYQRSYGDFYRSTDGGATWTLRSRNQGTLDWLEGEGGMASVPGQAGHLWFAAAPHAQDYAWFGRGLWRSTDGGATWSKLSTVGDARMVALGATAPGASYPTLYAHAQVGGVEGIWRSIDQGATWDRLTVHAKPFGLLDSVRSISGDWNTFGRVYVGFGGNGFAVGQPAAVATYTIAYQANGATSGSVPVDAATYVQGASVTAKPNSGNLARTGYAFAGWNTAANGSGTTYAAGTGTFTMGGANLTLYARWTALSALPAGWSSLAIGNAMPAGSATGDAGTFTISGSGADIWGNADALRYAWQSISGDFDAIVRVQSQTNTNAWAKAGLMLRESTAAGSRHASIFVTPTNGTAMQYRSGSDGASTHVAGPKVAAPTWLKLSRRGTSISSYQSADGQTWKLVSTRTVAIPSNALIGLAVTSHASGTLSTAVFTGLSIAPVAAN